MNEDGPILSGQKCSPMTSFRKYKAYADIRGGSPGRERQMSGVVVDDGNFWRFGWPLLWKR